MSTYRLDQQFAPKSVAVVGVSPRAGSVGRIVFANLRDAGFPGRIHLINPRHRMVESIATLPSLRDLSEPPDVVVITTPAPAVPDIVAEAADIGSAAAIILTAGLGNGPGSLAERCSTIARGKGLRLIGPNCFGIMAPHTRFDATFADSSALPGHLAMISQSGAVVAGMLEWAARRAIGFSGVASIGDQIDVDVGDILDYFALDPKTRAILLYVEAIKDAPKFMSAARAAARNKPVIVIKAGRNEHAARAAATHTGALAGSDAVYDAAFRRAGLLRANDLRDLFDAAEALGRQATQIGKRLAILTNGGGIGVLAIDQLVGLAGTPACLSTETVAKLDTVLPATWSRANPVDIIGRRCAQICRRARHPSYRPGQRRRSCHERADRNGATGRYRHNRGGLSNSVSVRQNRTETCPRSMGRRGAGRGGSVQSRCNSAFRNRRRCDSWIHASRALRKHARCAHGNTPNPRRQHLDRHYLRA